MSSVDSTGRKQRLAQALRENLRRRRAQSRQRAHAGHDDAGHDDTGADDDAERPTIAGTIELLPPDPAQDAAGTLPQSPQRDDETDVDRR